MLVCKMVTSVAKKNKRNLVMVWVDYKKAFVSILHSWKKLF